MKSGGDDDLLFPGRRGRKFSHFDLIMKGVLDLMGVDRH